jgi:hypothetical protein
MVGKYPADCKVGPPMIYQDEKFIQDAVREWVDISQWNDPFAVTLTLKKCWHDKTILGTTRIWLTEELAYQNLLHFLNLLNYRIYGKRFHRFGARVRVFPVLEGCGTVMRYHLHLVIDCPSPDWSEDFPKLIMKMWLDTRWGYCEHKIDSSADNGWVRYITKLKDKKNGLGDAIDWMNFNNTFYCF